MSDNRSVAAVSNERNKMFSDTNTFYFVESAQKYVCEEKELGNAFPFVDAVLWCLGQGLHWNVHAVIVCDVGSSKARDKRGSEECVNNELNEK